MPDAPASLDWIQRLVRIDTTSRGSNLELLEVVATHLREHGIDPVLRPALGQEDLKANLLATIPAADGSTTGGVVISGHTDVVPTDGQDWSHPPFDPQLVDGRIYGRGTADMKTWIAVALHKLDALCAAPLDQPVHLALSYDEELGCVGGAQIVKDIAELGLQPRLCLVGEPTSMEVVLAHKGINLVKVVVGGVAAHSSLTPQGVNAIEYAAQMVTFVRAMADRWRTDGPHDDGYVVPWTTASVNQIEGGTAQNIVPERCEVLFEFRNTAEVDAGEVIAAVRAEAERLQTVMRQENPQATVSVEVTAQVPGLEAPADSAARALAIAAGGTDAPTKVTYGTEAGQFAGTGIDTVVVGPGDISQAHAADEFVTVEQVLACERFFDQLIDQLSVSPEDSTREERS